MDNPRYPYFISGGLVIATEEFYFYVVLPHPTRLPEWERAIARKHYPKIVAEGPFWVQDYYNCPYKKEGCKWYWVTREEWYSPDPDGEHLKKVA